MVQEDGCIGVATSYILEKLDPKFHADLKMIAERRSIGYRKCTIKEVILEALDREIDRVLKADRSSEARYRK